MNTFTGLYLCLCDGNASDRIAASLPPLPESVRPFRGSGNPAPGIQATSPHSVLQNHGGTPHEQQPDDPSWETTLLGTDQRRTVLHKRAAQDQADRVYTPYGHIQDTGGVTGGLGFNGERRESVTGHYVLGAGYRAYNPVLMRFHSPDSLSPFDAGGWNSYAYCVCDPVNFVDPTGHLPSWAMMAIGIVGGVALGVVSGGVGTLVAGTMAASTAAAVGNASMVLGVGLELASAGTGIAGTAMGGEEGNLLGKISMGLGLTAGVVGGFGFGMRVRGFRMVEEAKNIHAAKQCLATPDPEFDQALFEEALDEALKVYQKQIFPDKYDLLDDLRYDRIGHLMAFAKGHRRGVDMGKAYQQPKNPKIDIARRIRYTWGED